LKGENLMGESIKTVKFNSDYLNEIIKANNTSANQLSMDLGMNHSYLSHSKKKGEIREAHARIICQLFNADYDKLICKEVEKEKASDDLTKYMLESIASLKERIAVLEKTIINKADIQISQNEKAITLLKQMLMYGACEEEDFKNKASSYGIEQGSIEFAIKYLGCKKEIKARKMWLMKK
jgi:transcriptional regulator with XRE-family HTH domain